MDSMVSYNCCCHVTDVSSCSLAVFSLEMCPFFSHSAVQLYGRTHAQHETDQQWRCQVSLFSDRCSMHGGRCSVGRVGHGPPKILIGWATMHLAPPIIGL